MPKACTARARALKGMAWVWAGRGRGLGVRGEGRKRTSNRKSHSKENLPGTPFPAVVPQVGHTDNRYPLCPAQRRTWFLISTVNPFAASSTAL